MPIITDEFDSTAREIADLWGLPDFRFVMMPHPLSTLTPSEMHQRAEELPVGTDPPATSLDLETGGEVDRREVLVALLEQLERRYDDWVASAQGQLARDV